MNGGKAKGVRKIARQLSVGMPYRAYRKPEYHRVRIPDPMAVTGFRLGWKVNTIRLSPKCGRFMQNMVKEAVCAKQ